MAAGVTRRLWEMSDLSKCRKLGSQKSVKDQHIFGYFACFEYCDCIFFPYMFLPRRICCDDRYPDKAAAYKD
jgi:hypothetical protein